MKNAGKVSVAAESRAPAHAKAFCISCYGVMMKEAIAAYYLGGSQVHFPGLFGKHY